MAEKQQQSTDTQTPEQTEDAGQKAESKNKVTIEDTGPCKKKVSVEIPAEKVKEVTDEQYHELSRQAVVPGFRKGRAPRRLLEKRFGKETSEQVKLKLLAEASESALEENKLDVLGEPDIDYEKIDLPQDGPLKFDFEVEVRPEFELPRLEGIPIKKEKPEVTDEQVDAEIERICRYNGVWTPRKEDEPVEAEDQLIADAVLKVESLDEEQRHDDIEIYARENGFVGPVPVEKLDELLIGAKAGQTKETTVEVPKTFFREEYRGKKVEVKITIKDVKYLKPAPLDENLLKNFGVDSEDELRERIHESLQTRLQQQARRSMTEQVYKYMLDNTDFELPADVAGRYSMTLLRREYADLLNQGLPRELIDEQLDQLKAGSDQRAQEQLKTYFIMDKVAEKLGVEVNDEELNGQLAMLAVQQGQRPERMRQEMERNGSLEQFRQQIRDGKCVDKLLESAKITEIETKKADKKSAKKKKDSTSSENDKSAKSKTKNKKTSEKKTGEQK